MQILASVWCFVVCAVMLLLGLFLGTNGELVPAIIGLIGGISVMGAGIVILRNKLYY